jgi:hypothetical protein
MTHAGPKYTRRLRRAAPRLLELLKSVTSAYETVLQRQEHRPEESDLVQESRRMVARLER